MDLAQLASDLKVPEDGGDRGARFTAVPIPGMEAQRVALGVDGQPALLLSADLGGETAKRPPSIRLEHIGVQYDVRCRLHQPDGAVIEAPFTVIRLISGDAALREHFLRVLGPFLIELGPKPTRSQVYHAVEGLIDLFQAIAHPPRKTAQGLWGELFVIATATDANRLVESWHAIPEDRYDFNRGAERIEVKSSGTRIRRHRFSLEQLHPPGEARVIIASLLVESAGAGVSLSLLLERVHQRLGAAFDLRHRLDLIVAQTLGDNLPRALELRFDSELAIETLAFFDASDIPSVQADLPPGVSDVHFSSDLSGVAPLNVAELIVRGDLLQAAAPLHPSTPP
jgi:hypothetical protein